jgi:hypothetical protein
MRKEGRNVIVTIKRGMPTSLYISPKDGSQYMTIEEGNSTLKIVSKKIDLSKVALLDSYVIEAELTGRVWGSMFTLNVEHITFERN